MPDPRSIRDVAVLSLLGTAMCIDKYLAEQLSSE